MIKFQCEHCGQKLGVPEKHAGRAVRCTRCKEAARVPKPEPVAVQETEPEFYEEAESPFPEDSLLTDDLPDLAALGAPSGALRELQPAPASSATKGGGACPQCGAAVSPQAVICIQCGNNLKAGGKVKTKVGKAKAEGGGGGIELGFSGRTIVSWLVGVAVAGVCIFFWLIIAMLTAKQNSYLAWGTGGLIGLTVGAVHQRKSIVAGIGAVVLALGSVGVVKLVFVLVLSAVSAGIGMADEIVQAGIDDAMNDPELFVKVYGDHLFQEELYEPELQARIDAYYESYEIDFVDGKIVESKMDEQLVADIDQVVQAEIGDMSEEDKRVFLEGYYGFDDKLGSDPDSTIDMNELRDMNPLLASLSWFDALWIPLCVFSAYMSGQGKD